MATGCPLLDEPGEHPCQLRWSRAAGWPILPDLDGLGLRILGEHGGDILFAATGSGVVTRHLPRFTRGPGLVALTTIVSLRNDGGVPVAVRLDPHPRGSGLPESLWVHVAVGRAAWVLAGVIHVTWDDADSTRRLEPSASLPKGLHSPRWLVELRASAYRASENVAAEERTLG